ncbi:MAG: branched-chain amino acid ABC transporter permease [Candidatus Wolframiiraptor sp. EX4484-121]|nr:MAG: branched-chain amino acid ABC transporter permease [Candidatus Wolframiiraptor sp. EX4484-121]
MIPPMLRDATVFSCLLALLSTGLTLTYMTTKVPNFAHGSFAAMATYTTLILVKILKINPYLSMGFGFILGGLLALILYQVILKPLLDRGASYIVLMIATIGYDMILYSLINILADYLNKTYKISTRLYILKSYDFEILHQPCVFIVAPLTAVLVITLLHLLLTKTRFGIAMRAAIENPALAGVVGINVNLTYAVSWLIAGGLAGMAGALLPLWLMCNPDIGARLIVSVFAASIVGGLTNIYGGFLGGILIGMAEVLGTGYLSLTVGTWIAPYRPIIPLTIMAITLLFAPRGLTGISLRFLRRFRR